MIDKKSSFTIFGYIDLDIVYLLSIAKKYLIYLTIFALLISSIALLFTLNLDKRYKSQAKIVIERDENNIVNIQEYTNIINSDNIINNQIALFKSDQVLEYIISNKKNYQQFEKLYLEDNYNFIQKIFKKKKNFDIRSLKSVISSNFKINNVFKSDVFILTFESTNPRVAKLALEQIIDSYQKYEIDSKIQVTSYANEKISDRLAILVKQMDIAQKKLSKYKKDNELVDTGNVKQLKINEINLISGRIIAAKEQYQNHQNDLLSIKVADGDVDALLAIKDLKSRKDISDIKNILNATESNIQSLSLIYTDKHPKIIQAKNQKKNLQIQLKNILDKSIEQKAFELSNLNNFLKLSEKEMQKVTDELQTIEEKESGMLKFTRELESSQKLYESFLQRVKETNEAQNLQVSKLKIIEVPNLPGSHFYPQPKIIFIIFFFLSFIFAYILIIFKEINLIALKIQKP